MLPAAVWYLAQNWNGERFTIAAADSARSGGDPRYGFLTGLRFAIVGAGRLGTSLALALQQGGASLAAFCCRTEAGRGRAADFLGQPAVDLAELVRTGPTHLFLTVPDSALPAAVADLTAAWRNRPASPEPGSPPPTVLHTSGATSVTVLGPLAALGCPTLAWHPLQTFAEPLSGAAKLAGSTIAVTPGPATAYEEGAQLARALGGHPFPLAEEDRPLYHAAAVFASNYLVTVAWLAEQLAQTAGLREGALPALLPLMRGALDNLAEQGSLRALTGPLSRGDAATVQLHVRALEAQRPDILPTYRALARATLRLVERRGDLPAATRERLTALLEPPAGPFGPLPPGGADSLNP